MQKTQIIVCKIEECIVCRYSVEHIGIVRILVELINLKEHERNVKSISKVSKSISRAVCRIILIVHMSCSKNGRMSSGNIFFLRTVRSVRKLYSGNDFFSVISEPRLLFTGKKRIIANVSSCGNYSILACLVSCFTGMSVQKKLTSKACESFVYSGFKSFNAFKLLLNNIISSLCFLTSILENQQEVDTLTIFLPSTIL